MPLFLRSLDPSLPLAEDLSLRVDPSVVVKLMELPSHRLLLCDELSHQVESATRQLLNSESLRLLAVQSFADPEVEAVRLLGLISERFEQQGFLSLVSIRDGDETPTLEGSLDQVA